MSEIVDETGNRYGMLTVLRKAKPTAEGRAKWLCRCRCGKRITICGKDLRRGHTRSCGCLGVNLRRKHGYSCRVGDEPEYNTWENMNQLCHNPKRAGYELYGARGIKVTRKWRCNFPAFLSDMGRRPGKKYYLQRLNKKRGYMLTNCRWALRPQFRSDDAVCRV